MNELRRRMMEDMQLAGLSKETQAVYLTAVKGLANYYGRSPDQLGGEELRGYFLHITNERRLADRTVTCYLCGVKFLFEKTLGTTFPVFELIRRKKRRKLPVVLSVRETHELLSVVRLPVAKTAFITIYSCGLRLSEARFLRLGDIDADRMVVLIRNAKGKKDRYVPLPQRTYRILREYWHIHKPPYWLFPAKGSHKPIGKSSLRGTLKAALGETSINKEPVSVHTLRHSYATHLLDKHVPLPVIQRILGHSGIGSTAIYTHLTTQMLRGAEKTINELMADL